MEEDNRSSAGPSSRRTRGAVRKEAEAAEEVSRLKNARKRQKKMFTRRNKIIGPNDIIVNPHANKIKIEEDNEDNAPTVVKQEATDDEPVVFVKEELDVSMDDDGSSGEVEQVAYGLANFFSGESSSLVIDTPETCAVGYTTENFQRQPVDFRKLLDEKDAQITALTHEVSQLKPQIATEAQEAQSALMELNKLRELLKAKELRIEQLENRVEVQERKNEGFSTSQSRDEMAKELSEMEQALKGKVNLIQQFKHQLETQVKETEEALREKDLKIKQLEQEGAAYQRNLQDISNLPSRDEIQDLAKELSKTRKVLKEKESSKIQQLEQELRTRLHEMEEALKGKDLRVQELEHELKTQSTETWQTLKEKDLKIQQLEQKVETQEQGRQGFSNSASRDEMTKELIEMREALKANDLRIQQVEGQLDSQKRYSPDTSEISDVMENDHDRSQQESPSNHPPEITFRSLSTSSEQPRTGIPPATPGSSFAPHSSAVTCKNVPNIEVDLLVHQAVDEDSLETLKYLIGQGANVNLKDDQGRTPLIKAASLHGNNFLPIFNLLIKAGADINAFDEKGNSVLYYLTSNERLAAWGAEEAIMKFIALGALWQTNGRFARFDLDLAVELGNVELIKFFLAKGENVNNKAYGYGDPPLISAAISNLPNMMEVIKLLVDHGADLNAVDELGDNALFRAAINKKPVDVLKGLADLGVPWKNINSWLGSILHVVTRFGNIEAVRLFISKGADVHARNENLETPLLTAVKYNTENQMAKVKLLVENGADINAVDKDGSNAMILASSNFVPMFDLKMLIALGCDWKIANKAGLTALKIWEPIGQSKYFFSMLDKQNAE